MPLWGIAVLLFSVFLTFAFLHFAAKNRRPFKRALLSMASGALTLLAVDLCAVFTGVYLPVSLLTLLTSVIGGVPGVTLLLFLNLII